MARKTLWASGAALLLSIAVLSPRIVPYNMDEFVHYQALGCASAEPQRSVASFRDGCFWYDLRLPGTAAFLPLRSYSYIGSFPALPFYPFWRLIADPVAARVQGAVFFLVWLLLSLRLLRVRPAALLLAALLLPVFLATFLVDEGPVGLAAVLLAGALLALRRALRSQRPRAAIAAGLLAGALLFLGLWSKLVFACLFPTVAAFALGELRSPNGSTPATLRARALALASLLAGLGLPTLLLLSSVDVEGRTYFSSLGQGRLSLDVPAALARLVRLAEVAFDPSQLAPRNIVLAGSPLDVAPALTVALVFAGALYRRSARLAELLLWLGLGVLTPALLSLSEYSQWPHHAFYGLLALAFAFAIAIDALPPRGRALVALAVLVAWAGLVPRALRAEHPGDSSRQKDEMLRFVRERGLDRDTLQVHTAWGTYYIAQLFGDPARIVLYPKRLSDDPQRLQKVRELSRQCRRPLLVYSGRRHERFQNADVDRLLGRPVSVWSFGEWWVALYDPDGLLADATSVSRRP